VIGSLFCSLTTSLKNETSILVLSLNVNRCSRVIDFLEQMDTKGYKTMVIVVIVTLLLLRLVVTLSFFPRIPHKILRQNALNYSWFKDLQVSFFSDR